MSLFKKLKGTMEHIFHIGGPLSSFWKTDPGGSSNYIAARNYDDNEYSHVELADILRAEIIEDYNAAAQLDVRMFTVYLNGDFDGSSPTSPSNKEFHFCHTSGGSFTAGRVYYRKAGAFVLVPTAWIKFLITTSSVSGTVSLEADWLYAWNGSNWIKKCDSSGIGTGKQYIKVPFDYTTTSFSSTSQIPSGAICTDVIVDLTTAFNDSTIVSCETDSSTIVTNNDIEHSVANQYVVEDITLISSADVCTVNVTKDGTNLTDATIGEGVAYFGYVTPKV